MSDKQLLCTPETHHTIRKLAAERGVSMKALTEQLLRLGMVAPELAHKGQTLALVAEQHMQSGFGGYAIARMNAAYADYLMALEGAPDA